MFESMMVYQDIVALLFHQQWPHFYNLLLCHLKCPWPPHSFVVVAIPEFPWDHFWGFRARGSHLMQTKLLTQLWIQKSQIFCCSSMFRALDTTNNLANNDLSSMSSITLSPSFTQTLLLFAVQVWSFRFFIGDHRLASFITIRCSLNLVRRLPPVLFHSIICVCSGWC